MFTLRRYGGTVSTGSPSRKMRPSLGCSKPATIRSVVVFPQPDGPSSEKNSPCLDLEVEPAHRDRVAEALGHALEANCRRLGRPSAHGCFRAHAASRPKSTPQPALAPAEQARQRDREPDRARETASMNVPIALIVGRHAEADRRADPHRQRLRRLAGGEERDHEVVEAEREHEQPGREDRRPQLRQRDQPERLPAAWRRGPARPARPPGPSAASRARTTTVTYEIENVM